MKPEIIRRLARLDLQAKAIVEGYLAGLHRGVRHGFSVEFSEHRKYVLGDDVAKLDWRVFARTDRYYMKKFEAETAVEAMLVVDGSASMGYASDPALPTKYQYAATIAAALCYLMIRQRDPVGLCVCDARLRAALPPRARWSHFPALLAALAGHRPQRPGRFGRRLAFVERLLPHRGLVVLISDFWDFDDAARLSLARLRHRGYDVIAFHVLDPGEREFPFERPARFLDPERGRELLVDPAAARAGYLQRLAAHLSRCREQCGALGVDYRLLDTRIGFDQALTEYLTARKQARR